MIFVFLLVLAGGAGVLLIVSKATREPDGEKGMPFTEDDSTPLWDTDEHSDTLDEPRRAA